MAHKEPAGEMAAFPLPPVGVYVDVGEEVVEVEKLVEYPQVPQLVDDEDGVELGSAQDPQVVDSGTTVTVV